MNVGGKLRLSHSAILGVLLRPESECESIWKSWDSVQVSEPIQFQDGTFDSYSLTADFNMIKIDCYLLGSPTGGTGTECSHTIKGKKIVTFLESMKIENSKELRLLAAKFTPEEWRDIHGNIQKFQTDVWVWNETNWDD